MLRPQGLVDTRGRWRRHTAYGPRRKSTQIPSCTASSPADRVHPAPFGSALTSLSRRSCWDHQGGVRVLAKLATCRSLPKQTMVSPICGTPTAHGPDHVSKTLAPSAAATQPGTSCCRGARFVDSERTFTHRGVDSDPRVDVELVCGPVPYEATRCACRLVICCATKLHGSAACCDHLEQLTVLGCLHAASH